MKIILPSFAAAGLCLALLPCPAQDATNTAPASPAAAPSTPVSDTPFSPGQAPFPDGTRWAAVGDSITHGGFYIHFVNFYYMIHFQDRKVTMLDRGCNGDQAWEIPNRYSYDIVGSHPTVASIMLGMNDGGLPFYSPVPGKWSEPIDVLKKRAIDSYEKNLKALAQHLLDDKIPVIILTPSPYDDTVQAAPVSNVGYNAALVEEAKRAEKVAGELGVPYVDFSSPMNAINQKYQALDPKFSIVGAYRIHPGPEGHLIMAYLFLKAQHVPPDVARFNIKGTDGSVTAATKCTIDQVQATSGGVTFRYLAKSLPFPVERWYNKPLTWVPFSQDIDSEVFQVTDLPAGNYDIQIDGQTIRSATADELAAGVQMAEETKTPEYQQAYKAWHVYNAVQDDYVKLRDLVCAERTVIDAKIPRPLTLEQENPLIDEYLKTHPDKRAQGQVDIIRNVKPKEADLNAAIDAAITQARTMVVPQPHTVKISTAAAATAAPAGQ